MEPSPKPDPTPRVLVIDDDDDIREGLMGYLEDKGYCPMGAANGRRALELLANPEQRPCAIVLDMMMPVMDGRMFREEQLRVDALAGIPVVLISAYADLPQLARDLKTENWLLKPIDPRDLLRILRKLCALSTGGGCGVPKPPSHS